MEHCIGDARDNGEMDGEQALREFKALAKYLRGRPCSIRSATGSASAASRPRPATGTTRATPARTVTRTA